MLIAAHMWWFQFWCARILSSIAGNFSGLKGSHMKTWEWTMWPNVPKIMPYNIKSLRKFDNWFCWPWFRQSKLVQFCLGIRQSCRLPSCVCNRLCEAHHNSHHRLIKRKTQTHIIANQTPQHKISTACNKHGNATMLLTSAAARFILSATLMLFNSPSPRAQWCWWRICRLWKTSSSSTAITTTTAARSTQEASSSWTFVKCSDSMWSK